ncbi:hypothetical protein LCGC14_0697810 [marine sediment metagenome]|uniref:Uncharacterized protein n=1 Tax=marine sediment metagenome TaxID=412755 RepID=A0A0F9R407_9ZZZZ|nr:MAG: hypothetical protein Lokiarch_09200 [Candidatus Lokiarchaeum sp. GC14_75]
MEFVDVSNPSIMGGIFQREVEKKIVELCSLNYQEYLKNENKGSVNLLTKEILESYYSKIIGYFTNVYGENIYSEKTRILRCSAQLLA